MSTVQRVSAFLSDLQQLEKAIPRGDTGYASAALEAFVRHAGCDSGLFYLRDRDASLRLIARSGLSDGPDVLDCELPLELTHLRAHPHAGSMPISQHVRPTPHYVVPLRGSREHLGVIALSADDADFAGVVDDLDLMRLGASFLAALISNQRLTHDMREGDFQLKYRLWELESLYDIGLSIAATLNLEDLAEEILLRTISLINARRAALFLRENGRFRLYRSFGDVRAEFLDDELTETLSDKLLVEGEPISFTEGIDCIFPDCGSFVALPIRGNNEIIGVIAAADRETRDGGVGAFEQNDLRLLSLFASQVAIALENARLHQEALKKQAMERDLELAATIQRDIIPKRLPDVAQFEIAAMARPARQVGGDYHAFFQRDGALSMIVADVAGKSMPAALLVSALHAAVHLLFEEGRDLGDIATELNKHIHRWSAENKFITMVIATIDPEEETIRFVNAGHNPAYVAINRKLEMLRSNGLPIGIMPTTRYATQTRPFPAGSLLVVYSDGITEAENVADEEFENERLEQVLNGDIDGSPSALVDAIGRAVEEFVGEAPQKDDQTLVVLRLLIP
jgi:sigma-B regulation protein RsbU (phosphoserine phosphatase)